MRPVSVSGQEDLVFTPSSKTRLFPELRGEEVIVREWTGGNYVVHVRDADYPYRHYFLLEKTQNDQVVGFSFDLQLNDVGYVTLYVNDMQLYGDSCYFCGEVVIDQGAPVVLPDGTVLVPRFVSYGFVGRFGMADTVGGSWRLDYRLIQDVDRLLQMAVYHPNEELAGFKLMVVATAEAGNLNSPSCLVEIKESSNMNWGYRVLQTETVGLIFTDVLARGNDLFVSSHMECSDNPDDVEHWIHYVHHSWCGGFWETHASFNFVENATKVDSRYMDPSGYGWGWHRSDTPMRMCMMNGDTFCLSYTVLNWSTGEHGVIFHPMLTEFVGFVPRLYYDCCDANLCEIVYSPLSDMMTVLMQGQGTVIYPWYVTTNKWSTLLMGAVGYMSDMKLESLCRRGGRSFYMGGHGETDHKARVVTQQVMAMEPGHDFCFSERRFVGATVLDAPFIDKRVFRWIENKNKLSFDWSSMTGTVGAVGYSIPCFYPWQPSAEF